MKIYRLSPSGFRRAVPRVHTGPRDKFFVYYNGMPPITRGGKSYGWQVRYPVSPRDYPYVEGKRSDAVDYLIGAEYSYKEIGVDPRGNTKLILIPGRDLPDDGVDLVLWSLGVTRGGSGTYAMDGDAELLGEGEEVLADADSAVVVPAPVVEVYGPAELTWERSGELLPGQPSRFRAVRDERGRWRMETD